MLVASIKALYDVLLGLATERRRTDQLRFERYTEPCYNAAKTVFDDYTLLFREMRKVVEGGSPLSELATFLDDRRGTTLSLRHELRGSIETYTGVGEPSEFESSILGVLQGAFSTAHALGHFRAGVHHYIEHDEALRHRGRRVPSDTDFRASLLAQLDTQFRYIDDTFARVAQHYAQARNALLPKNLKPRSRKDTKRA